MNMFGIDQDDWELAKTQTKEILSARARLRGMIPYSEVVTLVSAVQFEAWDVRFFELLGEVSIDEENAGRGMLSVIVVHKSGDMRPGPGFFELASRLGKNTSDIDRCWIEEFTRVHAYWSAAPA